MISKFKHLLRWLRAVAVYYSGLYFVLRELKAAKAGRDSFVVLRYHRVRNGAGSDPFHLSVSPETFENQMCYLKKRGGALSVDEGMARLKGERSLNYGNKNARFMITFDDGYLDNYTEAFPILKKQDMKAVIFVTSGLVGTTIKFWWDEMQCLIEAAKQNRFQIHFHDDEGAYHADSYGIETQKDKLTALKRLEALGNKLSDHEKEGVLRQMRDQLDHGAMKRERQMLNWKEMREMTGSGIEIGAHGVGHKLLTKISKGDAENEILQSKADLEAKVGKPVRFFAYPGGQVDGWMTAATQNAGYEAAFLTTPGENTVQTSRFKIKRRAVHEMMSVNPWGKFSRSMFALGVDGIFEKKGPNLNDKRVRVLYAIDKLTFAGSQKHLLAKVKGLDRSLYNIQIICLERGGPLEPELKAIGIDYHLLNISNWNSPRGVAGFFKIMSLLRAFKPHITHSYLFTSNVFVPIASKICGVPVVISSRRDLGDWMSARQIRMTRFASTFTDRITANSNAVLLAAADLEGLGRSKLRMIYNGVNSAKYSTEGSREQCQKKFGVPEGAVVIGTLGNIRKEKDPMTLLRAFSLVASRDKSVFLLYAGRIKDLALKDEMDAFLRERDLSSRVKLLGSVENVAEVLKAMDVFAFTSTSEGFSNAILEAMAASRPVVASRVGGNMEQVVDGVTGYLFSPGNAEECAQKIQTLLSEKNFRDKGIAGRKRTEEVFGEQRLIHATDALYRELLKSKGIVMRTVIPAPDLSFLRKQESRN